MLILSEAEVVPLLSMSDSIEAVDHALRAQANQEARFPLRNMVAVQSGLLGAMPGAMHANRSVLGAKLVTFFPENAQHKLHTHHAIIALFNYETGVPEVIMDGRYITEIRTAATSAIATRALMHRGAKTVAILGTGVQARAHARALPHVMEMTDLRIWGRNPSTAESLASELQDEELPARAFDSVESACNGADVICTVTSASAPVIPAGTSLRGAHVNAVGSPTPHKRELPADIVGRSSLFVDSIEGALSEAGDIIMAIADHALPAKPPLTLLADVVAGHAPGRKTADEVTIFKSLGIAIEDVACAALVYERALEHDSGTKISV
jgi:ornithine cyclodeaminase/alanine dehydrogenase-like protein (mu-crystallin family)